MDYLGIKGHEEMTVDDASTAAAMGSGELAVFATPALLALVEKTAWKSIAGGLEEGQSTVGTNVTLSHVSATPAGKRVWCDTEVVEVDRRRIVFRFEAHDEAGLIGEGRHERFIVDADRFVGKARAKY